MTKFFKKKLQKIFQKKLQKLVPFCMFVFVVQKHKAEKKVKTSNFVSQKASINFQKAQPKTNQTKN